MGRKLTKPKHEMGKHTGYTRFPDGSFELCPMYRESIDNAMAEEAAIHKLLETVTKIAQERLAAAQKLHREFWNRVMDDLSLNNSDGTWNYKQGKLFKSPKENK